MIDKVLYRELSYKIVGICYKVPNELGRYNKEKQYSDKLEEYFKANRMKYKRELELSTIKDTSMFGNRVDFIVDNKLLLEIKAKRCLLKSDYYQIKRYLEAADLDLGLLINFRMKYLSPKRVLNGKTML